MVKIVERSMEKVKVYVLVVGAEEQSLKDLPPLFKMDMMLRRNIIKVLYANL